MSLQKKQNLCRPHIVKCLHQRELGIKPKLVFFQEDDLLKCFAEDKASLPNQNQPCEVSGQTRSTLLMEFSPDGKRIASTHGDHSIRVTDIKNGKCTHTLNGHPRTPWCIAFHPSNSDILGSGCLGGEVRIWDLQGGGSEVWYCDESISIASLSFHPSDNVVVFAVSNKLYFWDWTRSTPFAVCETNHELEKIRWVKFDAVGQRLLTAIVNISDDDEFGEMASTLPLFHNAHGSLSDGRYGSGGGGGGSSSSRGGGGEVSHFGASHHTNRSSQFLQFRDNSSHLGRHQGLSHLLQNSNDGYLPVQTSANDDTLLDMTGGDLFYNNNSNSSDFLEHRRGLTSARRFARNVTNDYYRSRHETGASQSDGLASVRFGSEQQQQQPSITQGRLQSSRTYPVLSSSASSSSQPPVSSYDWISLTQERELEAGDALLSLASDGRQTPSRYVHNESSDGSQRRFLSGDDPLSENLTLLEPGYIEASSSRHLHDDSLERSNDSERRHGSAILDMLLQGDFQESDLFSSESSENRIEESSSQLMPDLSLIRSEDVTSNNDETSNNQISLDNSTFGLEFEPLSLLNTQLQLSDDWSQNHYRADLNANATLLPESIVATNPVELPRFFSVQGIILPEVDATNQVEDQAMPGTNTFLEQDDSRQVENDAMPDVSMHQEDDAEHSYAIRSELSSEIGSCSMEFFKSSAEEARMELRRQNRWVALGSLPVESMDVSGTEAASAYEEKDVTAISIPSTSNASISSTISSSSQPLNPEEMATNELNRYLDDCSSARCRQFPSLASKDLVVPFHRRLNHSASSTASAAATLATQMHRQDRSNRIHELRRNRRNHRHSILAPRRSLPLSAGGTTSANSRLSPHLDVCEVCNNFQSPQLHDTSERGLTSIRMAADHVRPGRSGRSSDHEENYSLDSTSSDVLPLSERLRMRTMRNLSILNQEIDSTHTLLSNETVYNRPIGVETFYGRSSESSAAGYTGSRQRSQMMSSDVETGSSRVIPRIEIYSDDLDGRVQRFDGHISQIRQRLNNRMRLLEQEQEEGSTFSSSSAASSYNQNYNRFTSINDRLRERQERIHFHVEELRSRFGIGSAAALNRNSSGSSDSSRASLLDDDLFVQRSASPGIGTGADDVGESLGSEDRARIVNRLRGFREEIRSMRMEMYRSTLMRDQERMFRTGYPGYRNYFNRQSRNSRENFLAESDGQRGRMHSAINRVISGAFVASGENSVGSNIQDQTYRIQAWDFFRYQLSDITDSESNIVVRRAKIHNDANVDLSQDGRFLCTFTQPSRNFSGDITLGIFSLMPENLGECLFTKSFGPNAISVSVSPLNRYVLVGLATKRFTWMFTPKQMVAQVYQLKNPGAGDDSMEHVCDITHPCDMDFRAPISMNSAKWLLGPGEGLAYGTNRGDLNIYRPGFDQIEKLEVNDSSSETNPIRRNLMQMLGLTVPRMMSTATQTSLNLRRSASTQTDQGSSVERIQMPNVDTGEDDLNLP